MVAPREHFGGKMAALQAAKLKAAQEAPKSLGNDESIWGADSSSDED